jgi:restriction system protein
LDRSRGPTAREYVRQLLLRAIPDLQLVEAVEILQEREAGLSYKLVMQEFSPALIERLAQYPEDIFNLPPDVFERVSAELLKEEGFEVETVGRWNEPDGGVDILAVRHLDFGMAFRVAVQCKRYSRNRRVSAEPIRSLAGVLDRFRAHAGVVATTSYFTEHAKEEAREHFWRISLRDYDRLLQDLKAYGVYRRTESGIWLPEV